MAIKAVRLQTTIPRLSPRAISPSDVPTFASIAQRRDLSDGAVALALLKPHPSMPRQELSRDDVKAIAAYIRSLRTNETGDSR
jgi:hypothetical protein